MQKNDIIVNGVMKEFLAIKKQFYVQGINSYDKELYVPFFDKETTENCFKIYNSVAKRKRDNLNELAKWYFAIDQIKGYKGYKIIFGTLTFTDEQLANTSQKTRRRYVSRFLKKQKEVVHYIANIDFGEENNREHYHFLAFTKGKIREKWIANYWLRELKINKDDLKKTMKYILKLNNHCYKESTQFERLIKDKQKANNLDFIIKNLYSKEFKEFKVAKMNLKLILND